MIHCAQGKSRSVTLSVAFVAMEESISVQEAVNLIQSRRKMAEPNLGFMLQLLQMEKKGFFNGTTPKSASA